MADNTGKGPGQAKRPHVVIVGGGFGGLAAAKALAGAAVDITLIDKRNHHLFQPLLYQVATAGLSPADIAGSIRAILASQSNVRVLLDRVYGIDRESRQVILGDGEPIAYDWLIIATGATHSYFGRDEWAAHAPGLKTLDDAFDIRRRLLTAYERAERLPADGGLPSPTQQALLTSVVIGAGPTGVEMAGTMVEIARHTLAGEFRRIRPDQARVVLVEGGPRVLAAFPEPLSASARAQLERLGVEVITGARVTGIDAQGVTLEREGRTEALAAATVVWAAGVAASPLARQLAQAAGVAPDRAGRVPVQPDLSLPGHPEVSVVGDMAAMHSHVPGQPPRPVPGVSPAAKQAGRLAARNVLRRLAGQPALPFRYVNYGDLATIGRKAAVAAVDVPLLGRVQFTGYLAWLFWLLVHVYFLIGFRNRLVVLIDWAWAYWTFDRSARIVLGTVDAPRR